MPDQESQPLIESQWDPVYLHARKEAALILGVWFVAFLWTVPFCYFNGYDSQIDVKELTFILGMPSWVFWGIAVPWMCCNLVTIWFCFGYFSEDDLEPHAANLGNSDVAEGGAN